MICPRCSVGQLAGSGTECPVCGYRPRPSSDIDLSVAEELEQQARRELDREFEILRLIGRGGMSVVYLAQERELGREVALKILPLHLAMGDDAPDRFKREARIAASLDHPHIVPVHRVGATPRFLWYTMKFVRGRSLAELLEQNDRIPVAETIRIMAEVASALHYAHKRGVVHRDVKPGNIMLDESGWSWVGDFGVAKAFGTLPLTQTGGAMGTPAYMSPEQCYGKQLDGRADQYGLAVVTYECLAGTPPFTADSMGEYVRLHCAVPPPSLTTHRDDLPDELVQTVDRALSKDPEYRFETVLEFATGLGAEIARPSVIVAGEPTPSATFTPTTPHPYLSPPRLARPPLRRVGTLTAVGLAAAAGLLLAPGPEPAPAGAAPAPVRPAALDTLSDTASGEAPTEAPALPADSTSAARPVATTPARFVISTRPIGRLYIDGELIGESWTRPDRPIRLSPGTHEIRVVQEGYAPWFEAIDFIAGEEIRRTAVRLRPIDP